MLKTLFFSCVSSIGYVPFKRPHLQNTVVFGFSCKITQRHHHDILVGISDFIKSKVPYKPEVLIICGSGLGAVCNQFKDCVTLKYEEIPNFPVSTVEGHQGKLVFGTLSGVKVVCMQGRFHYYEGYSLETCTVPIRALSLVGVKVLIVTNAAGAVNAKYKAGDVMLIKDQINFLGLAGAHPLRGPNDAKFGPRFFPMNRAYDRLFIKKAWELLKESNLADDTHEGTYVMVGGPNFETIAEVRMLRTLGADAVGMSTVPEVLVAKHCGMHVFGFSIISNTGIASYDDVTEPSHAEVLKIMTKKTEKMTKFVTDMVGAVGRKC